MAAREFPSWLRPGLLVVAEDGAAWVQGTYFRPGGRLAGCDVQFRRIWVEQVGNRRELYYGVIYRQELGAFLADYKPLRLNGGPARYYPIPSRARLGTAPRMAQKVREQPLKGKSIYEALLAPSLWSGD